MTSFKALGLNENLLKALEDLGFETPTPIQEQTIPVLLSEKRDLVGLAQTGTGKTAAFGLPLLQHIDPDRSSLQAVIICPTRELCLQIAKDLRNYAKYMEKVKIVAVYGGASAEMQIKDIKKGAQIVVATPGRYMDLSERGVISPKNVREVVLDEADEMLNMGFRDDIDAILAAMPEEKVVRLFSATMPKEVKKIADTYMHDPFEVKTGTENRSAANIKHVYYIVGRKDKYEVLKRLLDYNPGIYGIVFCRTKSNAQEVAEQLIKDGYNADALHGDLSQQQRDKVMNRFKEKSLQVLVATDVAARGIDVNNLTHVVNYSLPDDPEVYTHRSGRTARAGKSGIAVSFVYAGDLQKIKQLENLTKSSFRREAVPSGKEVCEKQLFHIIKAIHDIEINEEEIMPYFPAIKKELGGLTKDELIKRFASVEFNRFLEYYRDAADLNKPSTYVSDGEYKRFFINVGELDGFDKSSFIRMIAETAGIPKNSVGRVDFKNSYSFFEIKNADSSKIKDAFEGYEINGRRLRVDESSDRRDSGRDGSSSRRGRRERPGGGKRRFSDTKRRSR